MGDFRVEINTVFALRTKRLPLGHLAPNPISAFTEEPLVGLGGCVSTNTLLLFDDFPALFEQRVHKGTEADV